VLNETKLLLKQNHCCITGRSLANIVIRRRGKDSTSWYSSSLARHVVD